MQPRAATTEIVGWHGDAIKIRLQAPPVEGAANRALIEYLARRLHCPRSAITIATGASARRKTVDVAGVSYGDVQRRLGLPLEPP